MPRAIWSGSISFGLISLPVRAYSATSRQRIEFDLLHDSDGSRIEYKRVSEKTGREVEWDHIVKGYELSPGTYVTFTKEELEQLQPEATHSTPLEWAEVEAALEHRDAEQLRFTWGQTLARVDEHGDLFEPVLRTKQRVPSLG